MKQYEYKRILDKVLDAATHLAHADAIACDLSNQGIFDYHEASVISKHMINAKSRFDELIEFLNEQMNWKLSTTQQCDDCSYDTDVPVYIEEYHDIDSRGRPYISQLRCTHCGMSADASD
jgi:hypothetical protein